MISQHSNISYTETVQRMMNSPTRQYLTHEEFLGCLSKNNFAPFDSVVPLLVAMKFILCCDDANAHDKVIITSASPRKYFWAPGDQPYTWEKVVEHFLGDNKTGLGMTIKTILKEQAEQAPTPTIWTGEMIDYLTMAGFDICDYIDLPIVLRS